jgi:homeobox protein cut-like
LQSNASVVNINADFAGSPYRRAGEGASTSKSDDPADKYGKIYEENMNPFTQFHRRVRMLLHIEEHKITK